MPKINFIGIGAQKSGTTWLDACLREHPDIFLHPIKEVHFFDRINDLSQVNEYEKSFSSNNEKIVGEITPSYILNKKSHQLIYQYNKNIKLIAILRDPTDRAVSQYRMEMSRGTIEFNTGLFDAFIRDLPKYGPIRPRGYYKEQLDNIFRFFKKDQVLILDYTDIKNNPDKLIRNVFEFLGVDSNFVPSKLYTKVQPTNLKEIEIKDSDIQKIKEHYEKRSGYGHY